MEDNTQRDDVSAILFPSSRILARVAFLLREIQTMSSVSLNDELLALLAEILECPKEELNGDSKFRDHGSWDSLAHLSTIAMIDETFGVVLRNADFSRIHTISDLADYVRNARAA